jgi:hypothetical protein
VGGQTFYDLEPTILYRQHRQSLIGSNTGFIAKIKRLNMLINGTYRSYNTKHLNVLNKLSPQMGIKENIDLVDQFIILRDKPLRIRWKMIDSLGIYRQTWISHKALYLAVIFNKL